MTTEGASDPIAAITESRPPATDKFTYLTILESHLSSAILPTLDDILQDAELTREIGWDLVLNLLSLPGADACLSTIARLGNPREVILKVLEALDTAVLDETAQHGDDTSDSKLVDAESDTADGEEVSRKTKFIILLGMLEILHRRIQTKHPSRFLLQSLQTVYRSYSPNQEMTAAVINLVHSLSGQRRPRLPVRKSSVEVASLAAFRGVSENAPDPEADAGDAEDPAEKEIQQKLLLSFVTCILEAYINGNDLGWTGRLLELYQPNKNVPGRQTLTEAFRDNQQLLERDATVGKLVALTRDLGLDKSSHEFISQSAKIRSTTDPLTEAEDVTNAADIALSFGGCACLVAYWVFSATMFGAHQPEPGMYLFPDHLTMLTSLLGDVPELQILSTPGTAQTVITIGLWLEFNHRLSADGATTAQPKKSAGGAEVNSIFMEYVHAVTLVAFYHPTPHVRNAASVLAGSVLHADPADEDRLRILYDLLENCDFAQLRALAVSWLREELLAVTAASADSGSTSSGSFATSHALETLQYAIFPDTTPVHDEGAQASGEYLTYNFAFLLQVVNFGLFLWGSDRWKYIIPDNMRSAVAERWYHPLRKVLHTVQGGAAQEKPSAGLGEDLLQADLGLLAERMDRLGEVAGFR